MRITVWTSWNPRVAHDEGKPRCIYVGETEVTPRVGDYVTCRDGFGSEHVRSVIIDLVAKEAEIQVETCDPQHEYGPCLLFPLDKPPAPGAE